MGLLRSRQLWLSVGIAVYVFYTAFLILAGVFLAREQPFFLLAGILFAGAGLYLRRVVREVDSW